MMPTRASEFKTISQTDHAYSVIRIMKGLIPMTTLTRYIGAVLSILFVSQAFGGDAWNNANIRSRLRLLPDDKHSSNYFQKANAEYVNEIKDEEHRKTAAKKSFANWKTFEDEFVSFKYPDHPHIELEVKTPKERVPVMGSPIGDTENTFLKCYRLAIGETTYALLLLDKKNSFDDGICWCGAVPYKKYMFHNDALFRFDLLESGDIKKVQILCNGYRLVIFEWTHLPMPQNIFVDLALGVALKTGPYDQEMMKTEIFEKYGFDGRLGFLEVGMNKKEIESLLGAPEQSSQSSLTYSNVEDGLKTTTKIDLVNDVFHGFSEGWRKEIELPPKHGSVEWIKETINADAKRKGSTDIDPDLFDSFDDDDDDSESEPLSLETINYIFDRFVELAPKAKSKDWNSLCGSIHKLLERGHLDERVLPIVRERFLEEDLRQGNAAAVLHDIDSEANHDLFEKRIRLILDQARKYAANNDKKETTLPVGLCDDLENLILYLGETNPRRDHFILEAMKHPHSDIRLEILDGWNALSSSELRQLLIKWLEDKDVSIRQASSMSFAESFGDSEDIPFLEKRLSAEKDKKTAANLTTALERLKKSED